MSTTFSTINNVSMVSYRKSWVYILEIRLHSLLTLIFNRLMDFSTKEVKREKTST